MGARLHLAPQQQLTVRPRLRRPLRRPTPTVGYLPDHPAEQYTANAPGHRERLHRLHLLAQRRALVTAGGGGRLRTNQPGYHRTSTASSSPDQAPVQQVDGPRGVLLERLDRGLGRHSARSAPTAATPARTETDPLVTGGQVAGLSGGSGKASFYSTSSGSSTPTRSSSSPGASTSRARLRPAGRSLPHRRPPRAGADGTLPPWPRPAVDDQPVRRRLGPRPAAGQDLQVRQSAGLTLSAEGFNIFNSGTVLSRFRYANSAAFITTIAGRRAGHRPHRGDHQPAHLPAWARASPSSRRLSSRTFAGPGARAPGPFSFAPGRGRASDIIGQ